MINVKVKRLADNDRRADEKKKKEGKWENWRWKKKKGQSVLEYQTFADDFATCQRDKNRRKNLTKLKCARKVFVGLQKTKTKKTHSKQWRNPAITAISHQPAGALHMLMPLQPVTLIFMASLSTQPDIMLACHRHDLWPQWLSALMKL